MANNKFYDDYLMHSGRKGMKWGYNIYNKDYTPHGNKANPSSIANIPDSLKISTKPTGVDKRDVDTISNSIRATTQQGVNAKRNQSLLSSVSAINKQGKHAFNQAITKSPLRERPEKYYSRTDTRYLPAINMLGGTQAVGMKGLESYKKAKPNINKQKAEDRRIKGAPMEKNAAYWRRQKNISAKESDLRNSRSDIGNALADAKEDLTKIKNKGKKKVKSLLKRFFG